jgi:NAD(P)-dependent dehydrogenase (short-subunit alcohol dehydrogenase family)
MESILDHFSLHGKKALVVCPENPYGREIIEGLISGFAEVWLAGDPARMPDLPVAGKIPYIHGDAASAAELEQIIRQQMGTLDILVENGLHTQVAGWEQDFTAIYSQLEKTHLGMMLTVQSLGHIFADQGHGSVTLVTDYGGLVGYDPQNYASDEATEDFSLVKGFIKGAAVNYARQASNYLAEHGCRCNTVAFSPLAGENSKAFETQFIRHSQVKRMLQPADIAHAIVFLASDASAFITGITLPVDGGYTAK